MFSWCVFNVSQGCRSSCGRTGRIESNPSSRAVHRSLQVSKFCCPASLGCAFQRPDLTSCVQAPNTPIYHALVSGTRNRQSHRTQYPTRLFMATQRQDTAETFQSIVEQSSLSSETKTDRHRPSNKLSSRLPPPNLPICPCVLAYCTTVTFAATRSLHPGLAHLPKSNLDVLLLLLHIPYTKYHQLFSPRPLFSAQNTLLTPRPLISARAPR